MQGWTARDIPDQTGRTAVVTGANTGIGYETALALARKGARVVLACRDPARGEAALGRMRAALAQGRGVEGGSDQALELRRLDLAHLDSVRAFARSFRADHQRLDLLINNAGVMIPPFTRSPDGIELQMAVNHFGHFALTGLLLERLNATPGARVVTVASVAHRRGRIDFANLRGERPYRPTREYAQSKLANLMFARDLQRRLARAGHGTVSLAAHPGWVPTDLQRHNRLIGTLIYVWYHDAASGARPTLYAATAPAAAPGGYYGPSGLAEYRGPPGPARVSAQARDPATAAELWRVSESVTGVPYLSELHPGTD